MPTQVSTLLTAEEFHTIGDIGPAELIHGKVVRLVASKPKHGRITLRLSSLIDQFVQAHKLGVVYAAETGYLLEREPDIIRCPDVSFVRAEIAKAHDEDDYFPHSPDLAVEVVSPTDRAGKIKDKIQVWLDGGARSVWVVDPDEKTLAAYHPESPPQVFRCDEVFRDDLVSPGFTIDPLDQIFTTAT